MLKYLRNTGLAAISLAAMAIAAEAKTTVTIGELEKAEKDGLLGAAPGEGDVPQPISAEPKP